MTLSWRLGGISGRDNFSRQKCDGNVWKEMFRRQISGVWGTFLERRGGLIVLGGNDRGMLR